VVFGLGKQFNTVALERGDDLCPYVATHVTVAQFFGNVLLAADAGCRRARVAPRVIPIPQMGCP
jgi:hypothetical protein